MDLNETRANETGDRAGNDTISRPVDRRRAVTEPGFERWGVYSRECATRRTLARIADK